MLRHTFSHNKNAVNALDGIYGYLTYPESENRAELFPGAYKSSLILPWINIMLDPSACGEVRSKIRVNLLFRRQGWQFCLRGISLKATRQLFRVQGTIQRPVTGPRPCEMARSTHNSRPKKTYEQRTLVCCWSLRDLGFIARLLEMASACSGITANQPPYSLVLPCFVQRNPPLASMGGFPRRRF